MIFFRVGFLSFLEFNNIFSKFEWKLSVSKNYFAPPPPINLSENCETWGDYYCFHSTTEQAQTLEASMCVGNEEKWPWMKLSLFECSDFEQISYCSLAKW